MALAEAVSICRYSLTDRELKSVPIRWPEGGEDWDVGYRFFTPDQGLYMTVIDWDTGTGHFDSESFQALLVYVSQYPDSVAGGREEEPLSSRIQKGEVLFAVAELYPPFILWDYVKMFGEDAACIGFPTADGRGGHLLIGSDAYGIAAVSEHKDSAWDFIEESLTQGKKGELYAELFISYPSLKKALDEKVEIAVEREEMDRDDINAVLELISDATPFFSVKEDEII